VRTYLRHELRIGRSRSIEIKLSLDDHLAVIAKDLDVLRRASDKRALRAQPKVVGRVHVEQAVAAEAHGIVELAVATDQRERLRVDVVGVVGRDVDVAVVRDDGQRVGTVEGVLVASVGDDLALVRHDVDRVAGERDTLDRRDRNRGRAHLRRRAGDREASCRVDLEGLRRDAHGVARAQLHGSTSGQREVGKSWRERSYVCVPCQESE